MDYLRLFSAHASTSFLCINTYLQITSFCMIFGERSGVFVSCPLSVLLELPYYLSHAQANSIVVA